MGLVLILSAMIPEQMQDHGGFIKQATMSSTNTRDGREILGAGVWAVIG